jgi:ABC-type transport system involved in multi-copper enzyme maturation permease subunit
VSETTKALFKDALYQVLDNKVFRILALLIIVLVLPTFLIAAKPDELVILFGWKTYDYASVLSTFSLPMPEDMTEAHATVIQSVQTLLVDQIGGTFGLVFVIAATAFFVPRMVEKGAADTIFSKPVSRTALLLSRYVAGLLFVAILTTVLVLGMHIGLMLNSGYSDPGFLWSIPVMVYKYAILHAFSLLIAVWTRSSVAAILTTLMFFAFNGCVHSGWQVKEIQQERVKLQLSAGEPESGDDPSALLDAFLATLDVLHYTLPKTSDAEVISKSLRASLAERSMAFKDQTTGLRILTAPPDLTRREVPDAELPLIARWSDDAGEASISLKRWNFKEHKRRDALKELDRQLKDMGITEVKKDREWVLDDDAEMRQWTEPRGESKIDRTTYLINGLNYLFVLEYEFQPGWRDESNRGRSLRSFRHSFEQEGVAGRREHDLFESRAAWGGELKYNLWFSIGSTLLFIAAILGLACWKLSRVDF